MSANETNALLLTMKGTSRSRPIKAANVRKQLGMRPNTFDALLESAVRQRLVCTAVVSKKRIETLMVWLAGAELENPLSIHRQRAAERRQPNFQPQP